MDDNHNEATYKVIFLTNSKTLEKQYNSLDCNKRVSKPLVYKLLMRTVV